jgi:hypothetical protein
VLRAVKFRFYYAGTKVRDLNMSPSFYTKAIRMEVVGKWTMSHGGKSVHLGRRRRLRISLDKRSQM